MLVPAVVIVIVAIQLTLPPTVTIGPLWLIPLIELVGIPLGIAIRAWPRRDGTWRTDRFMDRSMDVYLCFLAAASALNAVLLLTTLLSGSEDSPVRLLLAGFGVLVINVFTFGLIYWWIDGGGPVKRATGQVVQWDFQYPQQASGPEQTSGQAWTPRMLDYFYTAYTNIIAFSPTDTMPLTHRVKMLFTLQSSISLVTILVITSVALIFADKILNVLLIPAGGMKLNAFSLMDGFMIKFAENPIWMRYPDIPLNCIHPC